MSRVTTTLLCAATAAGLWAENWPQFRGPNASGVGTGNPPVEWNGETGKNVRWKTDVAGLGHSSPVIWGDRLFVTTAVPVSGSAAKLKVGLYGAIEPVENEGAQRFQVVCLDRRTGKVLWTQTAVEGVPKVKRHPKSTHANPTPATDGKHLVALFGSEGLYVYDLNGKLLWKKDLGVLDSGFFRVPEAQWGFASSPIIYKDRVIVQADVQKNSFLAAFDVKTGKELWRTSRGDVPTFGTPTVLPDGKGGMQVVVNGWKQSGGYDVETGKELWRLTGGGDIPTPTPVGANGLIVLTSAHGDQRPIYAIKESARGDITEQKDAFAWRQDRAGNYMQTPVVVDGIGYFCNDNGILSAYQMSTGERLYQQRLAQGNSGFSASAVAAGGRLYVTSEEGVTHVIALGPKFQELGKNELGETVMATPAVVGEMIYFRGRGRVWGVGGR